LRLSLLDSPICVDFGTDVLVCARAFLGSLVKRNRPPGLNVNGSGVLTRCPSKKAVRFSLGPTNPGTKNVARETLGLRRARISRAFSLLMSASSLPCAPLLVTVQLQRPWNALLPEPSFDGNPKFRHADHRQSFSARNLSMSQLLRRLISLSLLPSTHPRTFQCPPVRSFTACYRSFNLIKGRSQPLRVWRWQRRFLKHAFTTPASQKDLGCCQRQLADSLCKRQAITRSIGL